MIRAYNEIYLNDVKSTLAGMFDIAINPLNLDADDFANLFASSEIAVGIEKGNPKYLCGKSSTELLQQLLKKPIEYTRIPLDRSPEYWAGWVLAQTQWYLDKPFKKILAVVPFSTIISLYSPYHEAAEEKTVLKIKKMITPEQPLKSLRKLRGLSQKQLSDLSGVKLRSLQGYEQGELDIRNAQADTLYALAKTLDCTIEELIN